ncbi:MAG: extracellular solute-binding protein [Anaerolineales bacterium]
MKHLYRVLSVLFVFAMLLAACAPAPAAAPESPAQPAQPDALAAPAQPSTDGQQVVLKVVDTMARDVDSKMMDDLNAIFEAEHPGVKISRESKSFDDMKTTARLLLSAADGPDVVMVNQGRADMGALVAANLLVDLTPYAQQYGWVDYMSPGIAARNSFSPDGKKFGEGNLYGVPFTSEFVGVYYNREIFEQNGIEIPKTFAEFEAACDALKAAGVTPIVFGSLDGWPTIHIFSEIHYNWVEQDWLDDFLYGRNNVSFAIDGNVTAAERLNEWIARGYFSEDFSGIGYGDSTNAFVAGQGAMMITGSWMASTFAENAPGKIGFFLMPGLTENTKRLSTGGTGLAMAIRQGSANADIAAEYINFLVSETAASAMAAIGYPTLRPVAPAADADALILDQVKAWEYMVENNLVGHYLDWASPTMYDAINGALAELVAGRISPEEFAQKVQDEYASSLKILNP